MKILCDENICTKNNHLFMLFILYCTVIVGTVISATSCLPTNKPLDTELIEDIVIAEIFIDNNYILFNMHPGDFGSPSITKLTQGELDLMRRMLKDNYSIDEIYENSKAVLRVDISNTGIIEWFNINKLKLPPNYGFEEKRELTLYFYYKENRWWYVPEYLKDLEGEWPEF